MLGRFLLWSDKQHLLIFCGLLVLEGGITFLLTKVLRDGIMKHTFHTSAVLAACTKYLYSSISSVCNGNCTIRIDGDAT